MLISLPIFGIRSIDCNTYVPTICTGSDDNNFWWENEDLFFEKTRQKNEREKIFENYLN